MAAKSHLAASPDGAADPPLLATIVRVLCAMPELAEVEWHRKQWNPGLGKEIVALRLHARNRVFRGTNTKKLQGNLVGEQLLRSTTRRAMDNLGALLKAAGLSFANVVRTTVFLADMNDFAAVNEVYASYFSDPKPARVTVQAAKLPRDARIEIDAIASYDAN